MPDFAIEFNKTLALISIAGFAIQRILEILDPLFYGATSIIRRFLTGQNGTVSWGLTDEIIKRWLMIIASLIISLPIAFKAKAAFPNLILIPYFESISFVNLNTLILALAISAGTTGVNSAQKWAEYSAQVQRSLPSIALPIVSVIPAIVSISLGKQMQFVANVSGTANTAVTWELLEPKEDGKLDPVTGNYTAPTIAGTYLIIARSVANNEAKGVAIITVK